MKKLIIILSGVFFILIGCEKNDNAESGNSGKITVSLLESENYATFDKTVILYETDNYMIKTPLYYFLGSMNNPKMSISR